MLKDGEAAPPFTLVGDGGDQLSLADFRGKKLVLYFYPKADTEGCTREAQDFSGLMGKFARAGATLIGVSADAPNALAKFKAKYNLNLTLASDPSHKILEDYGVWAEKSMFGRRYMGIERTTFLIDEEGRIAKVWRKVRVPGHAEEVLGAVKEMPQRSRHGQA
jgi:peroxiredoxin Q/BCP